MKRLLLLFILSPVVLFGQARRKAIVDSIKATATNLRDVSALISKYPDANVERTQVADSGEYVTIVTRIHVSNAGVITPIASLPIFKIKIRPIAVAAMNEVPVPPPPPPVIEAYEIIALPPLSLHTLKTERITALKTAVRAAPPLPDVRPLLIDAIPSAAIALVSIDHIVAVKVNTVPTPPPPNIVWEDLMPMLPNAAVTLATPAFAAWETDTVAIPGFEQKKMPVAEMHLSEEGYSLLEKMEGFSPELYTLKDGGFTIGFGFFVPYGDVRNWSKGVTMEKAELMIREKMPVYEDQVKQYVNVPLTQEEFDALTMMAYNLGGFSKATSIVNDINSNADFEQLQKDWMRFVHSKAPGVMKGLMNRRKDELQVRNESDYQRERKLQIFKNRK